MSLLYTVFEVSFNTKIIYLVFNFWLYLQKANKVTFQLIKCQHF